MHEKSERPIGRSLKPLREALPFLLRYKNKLLLALFFLLASTLAALAMPIAISSMIDHGFTAEGSGSINQYFIALLFLSVLFAVFAALRFYIVMWIGERVVADIRNKLYQHAITLSPSFYETTQTGEVMSRLTTDTTLVQSVFGAGLSIALRSIVMLVGALIMLFITSAKLTSLLFLLIPVVVIPVLIYGRKVRKLSRASQDRVADASSHAGETLNAVHIIQAFTLENFQSLKFGKIVEAAFMTARRRILMSSLLSASIVMAAFGAIVCVLWIGAKEVINGTISPGTLGQFLMYATYVAGTTTALGEVWSDVQRAAGAMERLIELLHSESTIRTPVDPIPFSANRGKIDIHNIDFFYPSRPDHPALQNFSLEVRPGEAVALVGPSGAGKSTVFQMLLRFYDPQAGKILIDDVDIKLANLNEVRSRIGIVPQSTVLFAHDAMENIRLGRPEASDDEVIKAAQAAIADDFIQRLPQGYDTFLGEKGARLSGGQQQRIAIARAILKNPPILLLDEATSSLDAESEQLVQEALEHLVEDRTTIVIAHRLATVKKADRIIVMNEGRIVDEGHHEQLMGKDGLYARLAELQFGKFGDGLQVVSDKEVASG